MSERLKEIEIQLVNADRLITNLTNRVKTSEKHTAEVSKENKKLKKELTGLKDAHNKRVQEFIGNQGGIQAISKHLQQQQPIINSLRYAMSVIMDKKIITPDEVDAFVAKLMEEGKANAEKLKQAESNEAQKPSEESGVQSEQAGADEGSSGTGGLRVVPEQSEDETVGSSDS
jgi:hypothetical protein